MPRVAPRAKRRVGWRRPGSPRRTLRACSPMKPHRPVVVAVVLLLVVVVGQEMKTCHCRRVRALKTLDLVIPLRRIRRGHCLTIHLRQTHLPWEAAEMRKTFWMLG